MVPNADQKLVEERLRNAIHAIRSINLLAHVPILVVPEAKFGPTGGLVAYMFDILRLYHGEDLGALHIMCESGPNRNPGVPKDPKVTQAMVNLSRYQMRFDRVYFSKYLKVGTGQTVEGNIEKLLHQMRNYILHVKKNDNDPHSEPRFKWAGANGEHDDMMITFLMCT